MSLAGTACGARAGSHRRSSVYGTVALVGATEHTFATPAEPYACTGVTAARGTTLVAAIHLRTGAGANTSTVTDSAGNAWTQQAGVVQVGIASRLVIFTASVVTALVAATVTVDGGDVYAASINISVWSGVGSIGAVTSGSQTATTTPTAMSVSAPDVGDVVIAAISYESATAPTSIPAGFTAAGGSGPGGDYYGAQAHRAIAAPGTQAPAWTIPSAGSASVAFVLRPGRMNYLANGSFEAGATLATRWEDEHTTSNTITYSLVAATAPDGGAKAQRFLYDGATSANDGTPFIEIYQFTLAASFAPGDDSTFSVWISGSLANTYAFIGIESFTAANVYIAEVDYIFNPTATPQKYTARYPNLPAGTDHLAVYLQCPDLAITSTVDLTLDAAVLVKA